MTRWKYLVAALGFTTLVTLLLVSCGEKNGRVSNFRDLPRVGKVLPSVASGQIVYHYDPRVGRVLARTIATTNTFFAICSDLKLQVVQYNKGFPASELTVDVPEYLPRGDQVWYGYGKLNSHGRAQIQVYFEPVVEASTNSPGTLYLHIL
jgi:hypothetical protein